VGRDSALFDTVEGSEFQPVIGLGRAERFGGRVGRVAHHPAAFLPLWDEESGRERGKEEYGPRAGAPPGVHDPAMNGQVVRMPIRAIGSEGEDKARSELVDYGGDPARLFAGVLKPPVRQPPAARWSSAENRAGRLELGNPRPGHGRRVRGAAVVPLAPLTCRRAFDPALPPMRCRGSERSAKGVRLIVGMRRYHEKAGHADSIGSADEVVVVEAGMASGAVHPPAWLAVP
jgi:hypothetical protein